MKRFYGAVAMVAVFLLVAGCSGDQQPVSPAGSAVTGDVLFAKDKCPAMDVVFEADGGVKDYTIIKSGATFHIFHIADPALGWPNGGEKEFGHASSDDLLEWEYHDRIDLKHEDWSKDCIWAPHILEENGVYYMYYTGVEWDPAEGTAYNWQRIGLATSTDLFNWTLYNGNGLVLDGPWHDQNDWCAYGTPGSWNNDCRDPFVFDDGDEYVMFASIRLYQDGIEWPQMAIAVAKSTDKVNWTWSHYLPVTVGGTAESANLVKHVDTYYLLWTTSWDGDIKVATATDIDGPYTLGTTDGIYGYANETILDDDYRIYGAIVDDYDANGFDLRLKKIKFHPDDPVAATWDFTICDFGLEWQPYRPHDAGGGD